MRILLFLMLVMPLCVNAQTYAPVVDFQLPEFSGDHVVVKSFWNGYAFGFRISDGVIPTLNMEFPGTSKASVDNTHYCAAICNKLKDQGYRLIQATTIANLQFQYIFLKAEDGN